MYEAARHNRRLNAKLKAQRLPTVADCYAYMESCGWTLTKVRGAIGYLGRRKVKSPTALNEIFWTLRELRDAVRYGW